MKTPLNTTIVMLLAAFALSACDEPNPSHDTPWSPEGVVTNAEAKSQLISRTILIGDAGASQMDPLEASLEVAIKLAEKAPKQTGVIVLGDNIYYQGFPNKDEGQEEFDEDQLEDISHLEAQLQIAKRTGTEMFFVPGNHDWYAEELEGQAEHITEYSTANNLNASLVPFAAEGSPSVSVEHRAGISYVFIDSQRLIVNDDSEIKAAKLLLKAVMDETTSQHPNNVILLNAHHPLETMGPHAQYYTDRFYPAFMGVLDLVFPDVHQQDVQHPDYARFINGVNDVLANYPTAKVVYAAGHDHNLQAFGAATQKPPQYRLVSGAGSLDKITGVGHNDNTLFAVGQQGLMTIDVYPEGVLLKAFTAQDGQQVFSHWLWQ